MLKIFIWLAALIYCQLLSAAPVLPSVTFTPTPIPRNDGERSHAFTRSSAIVTYPNGRQKVFPLAYQVLYRSADTIGTWPAGAIVDKNNQLIQSTSADEPGEVAQGAFFSFSPDGNSLLPQSGNLAYLFTHFEYHTEAPNINPDQPAVQLYGRLPAAINQASVRQDAASGQLHVTDLRNVDATEAQGIWTPCAASQTPWGTHLGGEEYEPNAREFENTPLQAMNLYLGTPGKTAQQGGANPYRYGYKLELSVQKNGSAKLVKHYAMGRLSSELGDVMPDRRTVYMGDDGQDTVMFMFVADRAKDLSAGTLYAAIWQQQQGADAGQAKLKWQRLGHATDAEILAWIQRGIGFSDIFDTASAEELAQNNQLKQVVTPIYTYPSSGRSAAKIEYLRVKPGMEQAAAFLESRRYAALLGATTEFTKMEGVTHNAADKRLYFAMSYITGGMLEQGNGKRLQNHIALTGDARDLSCGAVYESQLGGGQTDTQGNPIRSTWVAYQLSALLTGARQPFPREDAPYDQCDSERIANPDNLKYSETLRTLFIGEDSGNHLNNFIWAYNVDSHANTRIFSAPIGAENTGLQMVENWNGHAYLMSNLQHPAASEDLRHYPPAIRETLAGKVDPRGVVGYLGGFPVLHR